MSETGRSWRARWNQDFVADAPNQRPVAGTSAVVITSTGKSWPEAVPSSAR
jgi:hypothetical protein